MTDKQFRRARWQLRRDFNLFVNEIVNTVRLKIDNAHLKKLRGRAWATGGKAEADDYAEFAIKHWRRWG